jgi:putative ABC transport system permease protein
VTRPPRLASWLAANAVRREPWRHDVLGDLAEEFADVAASASPSRARRWFWRQSLRLIAASLLARLAGAGRAVAILLFIGERPMSNFVQELRLASRALRRRPGVTAAIVLTLAIGLGLNAAIFSMIDALLLNPFSFKDVDRMTVLAELSENNPYPKESVAPANFRDFQTQLSSYDGLAAYSWVEANLSGGDEPERISAFGVSGAFFDMLGARPALGRLIDERDQTFGQHHSIVLSDGLWRRRFGANPDIVGSSVLIDGTPYTVVGVAQPGFVFPESTMAWTPLALSPEDAANRRAIWLTVFGRLKPGVSRDAAAKEATAVYERLREANPDALRTRHLETQAFTIAMIDFGMPTVLGLWQAAALLVLLIAGTNVMNLLLARSEERQRELSVRAAIGATRIRIVRQLVVESMLLATVAVPGALAVAWVGLRALKSMMPATLIRFVPGWDRMTVSWPLLAWTTLFACLAGAVFGLLPAWQASRPNLAGALKDGGRNPSAAAGRGRVRRGLVIAEIAVALPLLVASGLAALGVQRFVNGDQGYDAANVMRAGLVLPDPAYESLDAMRQFTERWQQALEREPGIASVGIASILPATGSDRSRTIEIEGHPVDPDHPIDVNFRQVTPGLLDTLRIPLVGGRGIETSDRGDTRRVGVVSRSMADKFWPGESPIGKRVKAPGVSPEWITVVGVSGDVIHNWFSARNVPTLYVPISQAPTHSLNVVVRSSLPDADVAAAFTRSLAAVDPDIPLFSVSSMRASIEERSTGLRMIGRLMLVFGAVALLLAAIGIYSVMSFYVAQRRHEIGIRLALGASRAGVLRLTLQQASWLAGLGVGIGLALAIALAKVMERALFGVVSPDPALVGGITATLLIVAFVASLVPAQRATRVDPVTSLRD